VPVAIAIDLQQHWPVDDSYKGPLLDTLYRADLKFNYQSRGLKLSKHFV